MSSAQWLGVGLLPALTKTWMGIICIYIYIIFYSFLSFRFTILHGVYYDHYDTKKQYLYTTKHLIYDLFMKYWLKPYGKKNNNPFWCLGPRSLTEMQADGKAWLEKYGCKVDFHPVKRLGRENSWKHPTLQKNEDMLGEKEHHRDPATFW